MKPQDLMIYLVGTPALPGARCRGRPHLFDARDRENESEEAFSARAAQAVTLCDRCPSRTPCQTWYRTLTPRERPSGIVAGQLAGSTTQAEGMKSQTC